jgi:hypothetical protein
VKARALAVAAGFALPIAMASGAARSEPLPLSTIPLAADSLPPASGKQRLADVRKVDTLLVTALDRPVCLQSLSPKTPLDWESPSDGGYVDTSEGLSRIQIDRLHTGAEPFFERIVVDASSTWPEVRVLRRGRAPLAQIEGGELPVYAYRTRAFVHLLVARGFEAAVDAFDRSTHGMGFRESCGFLHVGLPVAGGVSQAVALPARDLPRQERWMNELGDAFEAESKRFPTGRRSLPWTINASLSRVSRDPEALLSVLVTEPASPARRGTAGVR